MKFGRFKNFNLTGIPEITLKIESANLIGGWRHVVGNDVGMIVYMPYQVLESVNIDFAPRQSVASRYAQKMVNPLYYGILTIENLKSTPLVFNRFKPFSLQPTKYFSPGVYAVEVDTNTGGSIFRKL